MTESPAQLMLFGADDEAGLFHDPARTGYFSLLTQYPEGKRQTSHRLTVMPDVLTTIDTSRDTWLSQAEFTSPNRRIVDLLRMGLLFCDLDTYRMDFSRGRSPEALAEAVLYHCAQEGLPTPSILVFSGRGVQAKWLIDGTIPRRALPRWNSCQKFLVDRLSCLGADPGARDASRVLRLVSTVNSKSGEICRVIHVEEVNGEPIRYGFEYLCEMLLPFGRADIEAKRQARQKRRQLKLLPGTNTSGLRGFSGRELAWHRLEDLRTLAQLRGGVREGERMRHLFWQLNFLLLSGATNSGQMMYHEAAALARKIDPRWNYASSDLKTLYAKAKAYEAGERIEFAGKKYPPLYTPKNDTLIDLFQISDAEQKQLKTIISPVQARERDRERDEARRRARGEVERATYLEMASEKRDKAIKLRQDGRPVRDIAEALGVSTRSVEGYLSKGRSEPSAKSLRITMVKP